MNTVQLKLEINATDPAQLEALRVLLKAIGETPSSVGSVGAPQEPKAQTPPNTQPAQEPEAKQPKAAAAKPKAKQQAKEKAVENSEPEESQGAAETEQAQEYELTDLRKATQSALQKFGDVAREQVKAKLEEFGAAKLPELKEEHFSEFMEFLGTIKAED